MIVLPHFSIQAMIHEGFPKTEGFPESSNMCDFFMRFSMGKAMVWGPDSWTPPDVVARFTDQSGYGFLMLQNALTFLYRQFE